MKNYVDSLSLYKDKLLYILLFGVTIAFPLFFINQFVSTFYYNLFATVGVSELGSYPQFIFSTITIFISQIPFIYLVKSKLIEEETSISEGYRVFFEHMLPVYVVGAIIAILVTLGTVLFIVPGLILLMLFILYPYVVVFEGESWFSGLKRAFQVGKTRLFQVMGVTFLLSILTMLMNFVTLFLSLYTLDNLFLINIIQLIFNMFILPYLTFVVGHYYYDWEVY
ncbi:hypothetical protein ADL26_02105 [Thermoactinomyces vulgaris]|nr:hypothetical protein ADL26_02105 [Thermoactinomyces vulgaris]